MGAGKSKTALDGIGWLFWKGLAKRALIICPLSVYAEWPRQFERHAAFGTLRVIRDAKKGRTYLREELEEEEGPVIVIVNYEKLASLEPDLIEKFDIIVADEATKIKSHRAKRTKTLARICEKAAYVLVMTGTPVSKNLIDVFGEYLVMDPFWFGRSFWLFRQRYCVMGGWMNHQIVGYQREDELRQLIDIPSHKVLKRDVLAHLPPKIYQERVIQMDPEQRRIYKETQKKFWVELQQGNIDIKNAASRIVKLQEIANGFIIAENKQIIRISDSKAEGLLENFEEVEEDERIVVWCRFHEDIRQLDRAIAARFPERRVYLLHGKTEDREGVLEGVRHTPGSVLIAQIQTGGMGIDLTCSHSVFFYSNVFEYALREQVEDRHHRPGQQNAVTYIDVISEDTVDRKIQRVLEAKKSLAAWVMENRGTLADFFEPRGVFRR